MRTANVSIFHETVSLCFDRAIGILGDGIKKTIYYYLARKKINRDSISERFRDVESVLTDLFGLSSKSVMVSTLMELCDEYSLELHLEYADSLQSRLKQICSRVLTDMNLPKHYCKSQDIDAFEEKSGTYAPWTD